MPYKDSEKLKEYNLQYYQKNKERIKEYRKTPQGKKPRKISVWKQHGIQCDEEWDEVYEWYISCKNCDICDKEFVNSRDRCLDHDHTLEGYNIRGILCQKCNYYQNEL